MIPVKMCFCLILAILLNLSSVSADRPPWDCPACGEPGLTGNFCPVCGEPAPENFSVGDIVTFGTYPQTADGMDQTPIEWIVLASDDREALLLSRYGLDTVKYHNSKESVTWEQCSLRSWLNRDFWNRAFTSEEKNAVISKEVDNSKEQGYHNWNTIGGINVKDDKVFLLSYKEAFQDYFKDNEARQARPTEYAIARGANVVHGYCWWRLRSPGDTQDRSAGVDDEGTRGYASVAATNCCVRPAIWVNLEAEEASHTIVKSGNTDAEEAEKPQHSVKIGDTVEFGHYRQTKAGNDATSVEWIVLELNQDEALLVSRYALDVQPYHETFMEVTWENSFLRKWLNSTFMNEAFSHTEQSVILEKWTDNGKDQAYQNYILSGNVTGGNETKDHVFLLSNQEVFKSYYNDGEWIKAKPTAYAQNKTNREGQRAYLVNGYGRWWLRSPGKKQTFAAYIDPAESRNICHSEKVSTTRTLVRPALWINLTYGLQSGMIKWVSP